MPFKRSEISDHLEIGWLSMESIMSPPCNFPKSAAPPVITLPIIGLSVETIDPTVAFRPKKMTIANKKLKIAPAEITISFL